MTFFHTRQVRQFRQVCRTAAILLLACLPAAAQVTFSGRITVNTVNTTVDLANPAYYDANSRCQLRGIIRITAAARVTLQWPAIRLPHHLFQSRHSQARGSPHYLAAFPTASAKSG